MITTGGGVSVIVTVKVQTPVLFETSFPVQVTVETPKGNNVPEGGKHITVVPGQLSVAVART